MEVTDNAIEEFAELYQDFELYSQKALKIQTMEGTLSPFALNICQKIILDIIDHIRKDGRLVRMVILKARREGVSTLTTGRFYWRTSMESNRYAVCVTHEPDATDFLFKMIKRYHYNTRLYHHH